MPWDRQSPPSRCLRCRAGSSIEVVAVNHAYSARNSTKFFVHSRHVLAGEAVKQVVYQLEKLCRDVEPVFQEKKGWDSGK